MKSFSETSEITIKLDKVQLKTAKPKGNKDTYPYSYLRNDTYYFFLVIQVSVLFSLILKKSQNY